MGVAKFFKYLAERYPMVISPFLGDAGPPVDNMYLDMNGIIHNCTHGDVDATATSISEEEMARAMFAYVTRLFDVVQPRKRFFMCVDGVAPRAKMNQQRQRRFRAAYDLAAAREQAKEEGKDLPDLHDVFDSNMITPGTPFMERVGESFRYLIKLKMSTDPMWQGCEVVFSGQEVPGEGEHKILEFIRRQRAQKSYAGESHCLYGLDADLVMLALSSHEDNVVLLREVVAFPSAYQRDREEKLKARGVLRKSLGSPDQFVLLHIGVLRDYILQELAPEKADDGDARRDRAQVLNDFVLMCFLVGNDFIPHGPALMIQDGALAEMFKLYREKLAPKKLYLTNRSGRIEWRNMHWFIRKLGKEELRMLNLRERDQHAYECRQWKNHGAARGDPRPPPEPVLSTDIGEVKRKYNAEKMGARTPEALGKACVRFIEAIEWVWQYYTSGVPSWKWHYDAHYTPYLSDVAELEVEHIGERVRFDPGEPFMSFQQLLGVLPPTSGRRALPKEWHHLLETDGPLGEAFPEELQIDRDGARAAYEGVVLIPFLREEDIIRETVPLMQQLGPDDRRRNTPGQHDLFEYVRESKDREAEPSLEPPAGFDFPAVRRCRVRTRPFPYPEYPPGIQHAIYPLSRMDPRPGFCAFAPLKVKTELLDVGVTVFGMPSRKESRVVSVPEAGQRTTVHSFRALLGKEVWVGWPHCRHGLVCALSDETTQMTPSDRGPEMHDFVGDEVTEQSKTIGMHQKALLKKSGLQLDVSVFAHVRITTGLSGGLDMYPARASGVELYPAQLLVDIRKLTPPPYSHWALFGSRQPLQRGHRVLYCPQRLSLPQGSPEKLPEGFHALWGCLATVGDVGETDGKWKFSLSVEEAPPAPEIPTSLREEVGTPWHYGTDVARRLGIPEATLNRVCSSVTVAKAFGGANIGLSMIDPQQKIGRAGFARLCRRRHKPGGLDDTDPLYYANYGGRHCAMVRISDRNTGSRDADRAYQSLHWQYSPAAERIVSEYVSRFPLAAAFDEGDQATTDFDPNRLRVQGFEEQESAGIVKTMSEWVTAQQHWSADLVDGDNETLSAATIRDIERAAAAVPKTRVTAKTVSNAVHHDCVRPVVLQESGTAGRQIAVQVSPAETVWCEEGGLSLGCRVVVMRANGVAEFGARGTVVSLLSDQLSAEVLLDKEHLFATKLGGRLTTHRGQTLRRRDLAVLRQSVEIRQRGPRRRSREERDSYVVALRDHRDAVQNRLGEEGCGTPTTPAWLMSRGDGPRRTSSSPQRRNSSRRRSPSQDRSPRRNSSPPRRTSSPPRRTSSPPRRNSSPQRRTSPQRRPSPQRAGAADGVSRGVPPPRRVQEAAGRGRRPVQEQAPAPAPAPAPSGRGGVPVMKGGRARGSPVAGGDRDLVLCIPGGIATRMGVPHLGAGGSPSPQADSPPRGVGVPPARASRPSRGPAANPAPAAAAASAAADRRDGGKSGDDMFLFMQKSLAYVVESGGGSLDDMRADPKYGKYVM
eukprot:TRINITY_DN510_c2_g3_i1.p1 TRINITY_DN510_c2_g3~~TRINITY_DN510_c2_g3_i1.p1  ORF type:complete len:1496 (+),score=417.15 TRINITY_DN510_c2_g3_i1:127-4614(+)